MVFSWSRAVGVFFLIGWMASVNGCSATSNPNDEAGDSSDGSINSDDGNINSDDGNASSDDGSANTSDGDAAFDCGSDQLPDAGPDGGGDPGPPTCRPCLSDADCGSVAICLQYAGSDYCARACPTGTGCQTGEICMVALSDDGTQVSVCVRADGTCGSTGCGSCPIGTTCDVLAGVCQQNPDGGNPDGGTPDAGLDGDGGSCGSYDPPGMSSCCNSCTPGQGNCQANGCYGGWWCNHDQCRCHSAPSDCGTDGGFDGGMDGGGDGGADGGSDAADPGDADLPTGTVGPDGGSVSRLYFAVVGDTRPNFSNDTQNYPTNIITTIYQDVEAMNPKPQFVIATGDYMYADSTGSAGQAQMQLYLQARNNYSGAVFAAVGNHECQGYTDSNCAGSTSSQNYQAFLSGLVTPLRKSNPYYTIPINDLAGQWTAKLVVVACNAWDATQKAWLQGELANATTYTFVINHEPLGTTAPCDQDLQTALQSASYNLLIVGHTHTYSHSGKTLIEGVGGAPITGSADYGWATIEQLPAGGFKATQYDYQSAAPVSSFSFN